MADALRENPAKLPLRCPCCGCKSLGERYAWEICPVCFWEDDGQDDQNAAEVWGGPNGTLSLTEARANYRTFGASSERRRQFVRPPRPEELPEQRPSCDPTMNPLQSNKRLIRVGHSPDPDDAFMFHALANDKIDTGDLQFVHELQD